VSLYDDEARYYDALYYWKDYEGEVARIIEIVDRRAPQAKSLLDVACGTGTHLVLLRDRFDVAGVDLHESMLRFAREKLPGVTLEVGDMTGFDLGRRFDVITNLFSAIGHLPDVGALEAAIGRMAAHLAPGGALLVEPWLEPDAFTEGHIGGLLGDRPDFKIARLNKTRREGRKSYLDFLYAVVTPDGLQCWEATEELTLFTRAEMLGAFEKAGLDVEHDPKGLMDRGLYIASHA
jgi:SAM-dependent methyltransferase